MAEEKEITIDDVVKLQKSHYPECDEKLIMKAYNFAKANHGDQCRKSGEPYMIHPVNVAYILANLELDDETICAALLHDVVEDTEATNEDLVRASLKVLLQRYAKTILILKIDNYGYICILILLKENGEYQMSYHWRRSCRLHCGDLRVPCRSCSRSI